MGRELAEPGWPPLTAEDLGGDRPAAGQGDDGMDEALRALAEPRRRAVIAGLAHDHLFVGWGQAGRALALLRGL